MTFFDPKQTVRKNVTKTSIQGKGVPDDNPQLISTTVAKNTRVYDIFFITKDCAEEYPGDANSSAFQKHFGIIHFDETGGFGSQQKAVSLGHNDLKVAYSDHRPLWMCFRTNAGKKDGPAAPVVYVGTKSGKKFHLPGCPTIKNRETPKTWTSREAAIAERGPCGVCKP